MPLRFDPLSLTERSKRMRLIKAKDTKPEKRVRQIVFSLGFRYRLNRKDLPGSPDLVFPGRKKVVFVHGCFWHQHQPCKQYVQPKSRKDFWLPKLEKNVIRDKKCQKMLKQLGWKYLVVWECQLKSERTLKSRLSRFLNC